MQIESLQGTPLAVGLLVMLMIAILGGVAIAFQGSIQF